MGQKSHRHSQTKVHGEEAPSLRESCTIPQGLNMLFIDFYICNAKLIIKKCGTSNVGACGLVDRALDSSSEGLGFDSKCWPCAEVLGKLRIPHCFGPPSRNRYLVHRSKVGSIVAGCIGAHLARGKVKSIEHALS